MMYSDTNFTQDRMLTYQIDKVTIFKIETLVFSVLEGLHYYRGSMNMV
jgi:hypothetical protein